MGGLLLGLLLYLGSSPEAHGKFHHDADHCDHACVITAFAAGEVYYVAPVIAVRPMVMALTGLAAVANAPFPEAPRFRLLPICGPPLRA
jgi:hypothetical protein